MNLNENEIVANKYLIDFDLNDGCVEITSEKVSPSECETYVKKLCMKDDGNDYIFIPTDEELNLVNVSWESDFLPEYSTLIHVENSEQEVEEETGINKI